jgi:hypothetical protein
MVRNESIDLRSAEVTSGVCDSQRSDVRNKWSVGKRVPIYLLALLVAFDSEHALPTFGFQSVVKSSNTCKEIEEPKRPCCHVSSLPASCDNAG